MEFVVTGLECTSFVEALLGPLVVYQNFILIEFLLTRLHYR